MKRPVAAFASPPFASPPFASPPPPPPPELARRPSARSSSWPPPRRFTPGVSTSKTHSSSSPSLLASSSRDTCGVWATSSGEPPDQVDRRARPVSLQSAAPPNVTLPPLRLGGEAKEAKEAKAEVARGLASPAAPPAAPPASPPASPSALTSELLPSEPLPPVPPPAASGGEGPGGDGVASRQGSPRTASSVTPPPCPASASHQPAAESISPSDPPGASPISAPLSATSRSPTRKVPSCAARLRGSEAAALWVRGCRPMHSRLPPYVTKAAALCIRGCRPMRHLRCEAARLHGEDGVGAAEVQPEEEARHAPQEPLLAALLAAAG